VEVEQVVDEPADGRHVLGGGEGGRHHQAASDLARAGVLQERIAERQLVGAQVVGGEAPHQPQVGAAGEQVGGGAVVVGRAAVVGEVAGVLVDAQQRQGGDRGRDGHGGGVQLAREQGGGGADALADAARRHDRPLGGGVVVVERDGHLAEQRVERLDAAGVGGVDDDQLAHPRQVDAVGRHQVELVAVEGE